MLKPTSGDAHRSKKLLTNEPRKTSKEAECRRHSPSIVARLMGLEALPGPGATSKNKRKTVETSYQKMEFERQKNQSELLLHAYQRYPRNSLLSERHPSQRYVMEKQEFKDIFEIGDMPRFHNLGCPRYQDSTLRSRLSETDMAFVRRKFVDAKRLSTDEKLHNSKEFHHVLDDLHSNKDIFLRVLQEPNSPMTKHPYNVQSVPSHSPSSHITVLKSSKSRMEVELSRNYGNGNIYWKRMSEGRIGTQGMSGRFLSKDNVHFSSGRTSGYPSDRRGQSRQSTSSNHPTPTRIVVLKPRSVPQPGLSPSQNSFTSHIVQRVQQTTSQETCEEEVNWQKLSKDSSMMNKRSARLSSKYSREVSNDATRKLRRCVARSSFSMSSLPSFIGEEQPYDLPTADSAHGLEVSSTRSGMIYHQNTKLNFWPSRPTDTPRSKEAEEIFSERWTLSTSSRKLGHLGRSSSTLGEMLSMRELKTESESSSLTSGYMIGKDGSCNNSAGEVEPIGWQSKTARISRHFKQAGYAADMTRLRSRTVSTEECELAKAVNRFGSVGGIVNDLISKEVNMPGPQLPFSRRHSNLKERTFMRDRHSDYYRPNSCRIVKSGKDRLSSSDDCFIHQCWSLNGQSSSKSEMVWNAKCPVNFSDYPGESRLQKLLPVTECYCDLAAQHHDDIPSQELEPSLQAMNLKKDPYSYDLLTSDKNFAEVFSTGNCLVTSPCCGLPKTGVQDIKDDSMHKESQEQPSPVSILEPPFEEESSSSECFEKISADLDGLRKQLRLLRMESSHKYAEVLEFESSSVEECAAGCRGGVDPVEQAECLGDERVEFKFLRDVLISSGICGDQNSLSAWHSPDSPLNPCLFDQLNQKYCKRENQSPGNTKDMWVQQRSQWRLLFDRINTGLKEILQPNLSSHSWMQSRARSGLMQQWGVQQLAEKLGEMIQNDETESRGLVEIMLAKDLVRDVERLELRDDVGFVGVYIEQALVGDLIIEMVDDLYNVTSQSSQ